MYKCNCGALLDNAAFYRHTCPGVLIVNREPIFSDNWSATLWNVRELRKELAELRAELRGEPLTLRMGFDDGPQHPDRLALAAHWAEHD